MKKKNIIKKKLGKIENTNVFIDFSILTKYYGILGNRIENQIAFGSLLRRIIIVFVFISIVLMILSGDFSLDKFISLPNIFYVSPYISVPFFIISLFYTRDRTLFDFKKINLLSDLKKEIERDLNLENYLSLSVKVLIDSSLHNDGDFFKTFTQRVFTQSSSLIEERIGVTQTELFSLIDKVSINKNKEEFISEVLFDSMRIAMKIYSNQIGIDSILIVLLNNYFKEELKVLNISVEDINSLEEWFTKENNIKNFKAQTKKYRRKLNLNKFKTLKRFGKEFNFEKNSKSLSYIIDRESELDNFIQNFLYSKEKNLAFVIGKPGVGKSEFIKSSFIKLVSDLNFFHNINIFEILGGKIEAQSRDLSEINKTVEKIFDETKIFSPVLIFEDFTKLFSPKDIYGKGLLNSLLNYLNESKAKIIIPISEEDFKDLKKYTLNIENYSFKIFINEQNNSINQQVLLDLVPEFEKKYGVKIGVDGIKSLINCADDFYYEKTMPEKGIFLLERCCSIAMSRSTKFIDSAFVIEVMNDFIGDRKLFDEKREVEELKLYLTNNFIGQKEAIDLLTSSLRNIEANVRKKRKNKASFMFYGPEGVGKSKLAKLLSTSIFGSEKMMLEIDFADVNYKNGIGKLLGYQNSEGNYVAGVLTSFVKSRPYSLILFKNIEKGEKKILKLLKEILENGNISDVAGINVDFKNTIIILTSEFNSAEIITSIKKGEKYDEIRKRVLRLINKNFDFVQELDNFILFSILTKFELLELADSLLINLKNSLLYRGIELEWNKSTLEKLVGFSIDQNQDNLRIEDVIKQKIEDKIAILIIQNRLKSGVNVKLNGLEIII